MQCMQGHPGLKCQENILHSLGFEGTIFFSERVTLGARFFTAFGNH